VFLSCVWMKRTGRECGNVKKACNIWTSLLQRLRALLPELTIKYHVVGGFGDTKLAACCARISL
jgi:hypothetical protein